MTDIKTDRVLLDALRNAAGRPLTQSELHQQRVSFIMASVDEKSNVTRERIEEVLAQMEGVEA